MNDQKHFVGDGCSSHDKAKRAAVEDIVDLQEAAIRLDIPKKRLLRWRERGEAINFPPPVRVISKKPVFDFVEIFAWHAIWTHTRGGDNE